MANILTSPLQESPSQTIGDDSSLIGGDAMKPDQDDQSDPVEKVSFAIAASAVVEQGEESAQADLAKAESQRQSALSRLAAAMDALLRSSVTNDFGMTRRETTMRSKALQSAALQMVQKAKNFVVTATERMDSRLSALRIWASKRKHVEAETPVYGNDPGIIATIE